MTELILGGENGVLRLGENTLLIAIDDTGHEEFQDPNHKVFGLGGCAVLVKDYPRLIEQPWNYMCDRFFPEEKRPLHATDIKFSTEQIEAVNHFFTNFQFFRIAAVSSHRAVNSTDEDYINILGAALLKGICDVAKWASFDRLVILFESSDRIEDRVLSSLSNKSIKSKVNKDMDIKVELAVVPKSLSMPAMEVADFIIHTVGAQTRNRNNGVKKVRPDFEVIFRNVDKRLTSFMEVTNTGYASK